MGKFNIDCGGCTFCCKQLGAIMMTKMNAREYVKVAIDDFPYSYDERGWCEKLNEDGCSVYEKRPDLCNVDTMAKRRMEHEGIECEEHLNQSKVICQMVKGN